MTMHPRMLLFAILAGALIWTLLVLIAYLLGI